MKAIYYPRVDDKGNLIAGQQEALAVLIPDDYDKSKVYPCTLCVHGISERSEGKLTNLTNLVEGVDYDGDGIIDGAFVKAFHKEVVDKYKTILVVVTYGGFFDPNKVNWVMNFVANNYSIANKFAYLGFSYGAGAAVAYATSTVENAKRLSVVVPCAPTNSVGNADVIRLASVAMHIFVNDEDDNRNTDINVTKAIVTKLNGVNPPIKVQYTAFRQKYHGGYDRGTDIIVPTAPGGQGVINLTENVHEWALDVLANGPRQMKSGAIAPAPSPTPTPQPTPTVTPVTSYTIDTSGIHLRGDKSIGYKSGMDGKWEFISGPAGANTYNVFPKGSTYINADGVLPVSGTYVFRFILKGASPVDVTVVHGVTPKTVIGFEATGQLKYSDQSTETLTVTLVDGKLIFKNAAGQIINL